MADHRVPSRQANAYPHAALHQLQGQVQQNPHVAGNDQQLEGVHQDDIPQPVAIHGEMQHPRHIEVPNYNAAHYHLPPPPYPQVPQVPYVQMHQNDRVAEHVPAQARPFAPGVQENYEGYGAHFPAGDPAEAFPEGWPHPAPPADMPPAENGLINLIGRFLNNPGTLVNGLRIEPGRNGRFEVRIALELADIDIF